MRRDVADMGSLGIAECLGEVTQTFSVLPGRKHFHRPWRNRKMPASCRRIGPLGPDSTRS